MHVLHDKKIQSIELTGVIHLHDMGDWLLLLRNGPRDGNVPRTGRVVGPVPAACA